MCVTEDYQESEKRAYSQEKMFADLVSGKGLVSSIYKEPLQVNSEKTTSLKMAKALKQTFLQGNANGQQVHEKELNIIRL